MRGRRVDAAKRSSSVTGSKRRCVVPSRHGVFTSCGTEARVRTPHRHERARRGGAPKDEDAEPVMVSDEGPSHQKLKRRAARVLPGSGSEGTLVPSDGTPSGRLAG